MSKKVHSLTVFVMGAFLLGAGVAPVAAAAQDRDSEFTRPEISNFDVFLDGHAALARQLRANPALVNNEEFVEDHPALQQYLASHPNLREELKENPGAFMKANERMERGEAQGRFADRDRDRTQSPRFDISDFNLFLDSHPEIAQQLSKNPSLADDATYLKDHPALQQYVQTHPDLRTALTENPQSVMAANQRWESREPQGDVAGFDAFLDQHPQLSRQLAKDPSLIRNQKYLQDHPELQQFLQTHPDLRAEMSENPNAIMQAEHRWESREGNAADDPGHASGGMGRQSEGAPRFDISDFNLFLDSHPEIAQQLSKNPSLADDATYLKDHPALQQYVQTHPDLRTALTENPQSVMAANQRWESREPQGDVAGFDAFLDQHPQLSRQLAKDPSLIRNQKYLQDHPELQQFLQTHPDLRAEMSENPNAIMQAEQRWESREGNAPDDPSRASGGMGIGEREMSTFDSFLDSHPEVARQLAKDPSLANNEEFLENHPELQTLLKQNPAIQQHLQQNPQAFLKATVRTQDQHLARPEPKPLNPDPNVLKH